jgi:protein arginine N-methyltransferase 5
LITGNPINNYHNTRYSKITFNVKNGGILHGIAGYFESVLYKNIIMSILPETHSEGMFSWFPIFFPLKVWQ